MGDLDDGIVRLDEALRSGGQACLSDKLGGSEAKYFFDDSGESGLGEAGMLGQGARGNVIRKFGLKVFESGEQSAWNAGAIT